MSTRSITIQERKLDSFHSIRPNRFLPLITFLAMECALILLAAVLPLRGLWFHTALLEGISHWFLLPTYLLFPGWSLTPTEFAPNSSITPDVSLSWITTALFLGVCLLILGVYLLALRYLPLSIKRRYIVLSTLALAATCVLIPAVTSPDLYSYIVYARMGTIYHLNPLTTIPKVVSNDPVYQYLYWTEQPSAYGPTWAAITSALQAFTGLLFGDTGVVPMVLALRLLGLAAHVWSAMLIWSMTGRLQFFYGQVSSRFRVQATLAFAWNPLLLFEACVNAHNDTVVLLFVLLALWFLLRLSAIPWPAFVCSTVFLALATCLKINVVLLMPGVLLLLWKRTPTEQRKHAVARLALLYAAVILVLYAPFWQNGALLDVFKVNPGTYRAINTPAEFLSHLINSVITLLGFPAPASIGSPSEMILRAVSMGIFVLAYAALCLSGLTSRYALRNPRDLVRWMAVAWLLYCTVGTPWFWPWYMVTFFGLFALVESVDARTWRRRSFPGSRYALLAARILAFSMLTIYCFYTWAPFVSSIPFLPDFRWGYLRSIWSWLLPLIPFLLSFRSRTSPHIALPERYQNRSAEETSGEESKQTAL